MLVMFSGLPGSGKSAIADQLGRRLPAAVLSVDPIEAAICRCGITQSFETGVAAYEVAAVLAENQLRLGLSVIADAVNSLEIARSMWRRAAHKTSAAAFSAPGRRSGHSSGFCPEAGQRPYRSAPPLRDR